MCRLKILVSGSASVALADLLLLLPWTVLAKAVQRPHKSHRKQSTATLPLASLAPEPPIDDRARWVLRTSRTVSGAATGK